jgi:hypothetical protein
MMSSWIFFVLLVEASPTKRIMSRHELESAARAETGALGRLVYGIISTLCLCALSFALGISSSQNQVVILTYNRPSCNTIREKEKTTVCVDPFPHPDCGGHDACCFRRDSSIRPQSHHLQAMSGIDYSLSILVLLFEGSVVSRPLSVRLLFETLALMQTRYIFYLERIHIARSPVVHERKHDKIWVIGMFITVGCFGGMALWCIATPHASISVHDGHCRIGSDKIPSYTTFSADIVINIALTGVFVWLILPVLKNQARCPTTFMVETSQPPARSPSALRGVMTGNADRDDQLSRSVKKMLRRNIIGSAFTFVAGAINLVIYFVDATSQIAYVCYTLCIVDGIQSLPCLNDLILTEWQWYLEF